MGLGEWIKNIGPWESFEDVEKLAENEWDLAGWLWEHILAPIGNRILDTAQVKEAIAHIGTAAGVFAMCYLASILLDILGRRKVGRSVKVMGIVLAIKSIFTA